MDAVEVDIELFVTCRLCLDEKGTYQIIPSVQKQIKYCFDINIDNFDGLPQLLCKKCMDTLNDFYATKNKYRDIQDTLQDKKQKKLPITNIESLKLEEKFKNTDGVEYPKEEKSSKKKKRLKTLRKKHILLSLSSSSESSEPSESLNNLMHVKDEQVNTSQMRNDWEEKYNKYFVCHICKKECKEVRDIKTHMETHNNLIAGHSNLFQTTCKVNLNKIDEKSNFIGLSTAVVHNKDYIVRHLDGFNYYIVYKKIKKLSVHEVLNRRKRIYKSRSKFNDSDDDDTYENPSKTKPKKCRGSSSSTETVIVDEIETDSYNGKNKLKDDKRLVNKTPFVVIDDTSTESLCEVDTHHTNDEETKRTIKEVVSKTYDYVVSQDNNKTKEDRKNQIEHSESQLNHKISTIGTKVINKQDLPSTGLLSYLGIKPLAVEWIPRSKANVVNTRTFVQETSVVSDSWKNVGKSDLCNLEAEKVSVQNVEDVDEIIRIDAMTTDAKDSCVDVDKRVTVAPDCVKKINVLLKKKSDVLAISKISNLNPVSVPKSMDVQKSNAKHKVKQKPVENNIATVKNEAVVNEMKNEDDAENEDLKHVPVIKHANLTVTSDKLKEVENNYKITDTITKQESKENCLPDLSISNDQYVPKIKVKSELMPEDPSGMNVPLNDVPENNLSRVRPQSRVSSDCRYQCETPAQSIPNNSPVGITPVSQLQNIHQNVPIQQATNQDANNSSSNSGTGFMLLHSEQIPKTVTDSPFQYFRDILKRNNIILKETNSPLSSSFKCLEKLKLSVKQGPITKSLKISLWCHSNEVCINVVDAFNTSLDINMIISDWQWEILQVFKCDIMEKIIKCALKCNGDEYKTVCKFKDILNSIEMHQL